MLAAATGWLSGWSVERAFHFVLALAYCLGPVVEPGCQSSCSVELAYGATTEAWVCRLLSAFAALGLIAIYSLRKFRYFLNNS
jgi:hypothetical protein